MWSQPSRHDRCCSTVRHFLSQQSTGTRITVYSVCCPRSTDRIVQILGKPSDCGECIKQIIALVKEVISLTFLNFPGLIVTYISSSRKSKDPSTSIILTTMTSLLPKSTAVTEKAACSWAWAPEVACAIRAVREVPKGNSRFRLWSGTCRDLCRHPGIVTEPAVMNVTCHRRRWWVSVSQSVDQGNNLYALDRFLNNLWILFFLL